MQHVHVHLLCDTYVSCASYFGAVMNNDVVVVCTQNFMWTYIFKIFFKIQLGLDCIIWQF